MMQLHIFKEISARIPRSTIHQLFDSIYENELSNASKGEVNLIFTHDEKMKELNSQFRNKNMSTDVLSFNIDEPLDGNAVFGEIYISIQTAKRQAEDYKAPLSEEILRLSCHGFLHLLGYDHIESSDAVIMNEKENRYLMEVYA